MFNTQEDMAKLLDQLASGDLSEEQLLQSQASLATDKLHDHRWVALGTLGSAWLGYSLASWLGAAAAITIGGAIYLQRKEMAEKAERQIQSGSLYEFLPKEYKIAYAQTYPHLISDKQKVALAKQGIRIDGYQPPEQPARAADFKPKEIQPKVTHPDTKPSPITPSDRARLTVAGDRINDVVSEYQQQQQQLGQSVGQRLADIPRNFAQGLAESMPVNVTAQPQQVGELYGNHQMEDLVQILVDDARQYIRSLVTLGPSRTGKGVLSAYASKERKRQLGTIEWAIGAKRDPKESGYWSHCDRVEIFNFLTMNQFEIDQTFTRWIQVLEEFKRLDAPNGKFLNIDESSIIMKTAKNGGKDSIRQRFYDECNLYTSSLSSMGASSKSGVGMIAPTAYVSGLGIGRDELNTFIPLVIMHVENWDIQFLAGAESNYLIPKDSGADQARIMAQQIGCKRIAWYRDRWVFLPEYPQIQPIEPQQQPIQPAQPTYTVVSQPPATPNSYQPAQEDVEGYRPDWWGDKSRRLVQWQASDSLAKAGLSRSDIVKKMLDFKSEKYRGFAAALVELEQEFGKLTNQ